MLRILSSSQLEGYVIKGRGGPPWELLAGTVAKIQQDGEALLVCISGSNIENGMIKKDGELCREFDRLFKEVVNAGPGEATAIGNITAQMLKAEEFKTIEEARTIIHESFGVKVYK